METRRLLQSQAPHRNGDRNGHRCCTEVFGDRNSFLRRTPTSFNSPKRSCDEEQAIVKKVRTYMETKVQPVINKHWVEDTFPFELLPSYKELNIAGIGINGYGCPGGSPLLVGLVALEIARTDVSFCTFHGVHTGLADGFHLPRGHGGAEAEVAAADGAHGKGRLLRADRAAGGLGDRCWSPDHGEA